MKGQDKMECVREKQQHFFTHAHKYKHTLTLALSLTHTSLRTLKGQKGFKKNTRH